MRKIPMIGKKFERLTVVAEAENDRSGQACWECICECGNTTVVGGSNLRSGNTRSCGCLQKETFSDSSKKRRGKGHYRYKGGRSQTDSGYVYLSGHQGHPNAYKGSISEHVYVMTQMLGRPLVKGENVHHINKVRDDNRPENLELWDKGQPAGARVSDLIPFWLEKLRLHAPEMLSDHALKTLENKV